MANAFFGLSLPSSYTQYVVICMLDELCNDYSKFIITSLKLLKDDTISIDANRTGDVFNDIALGILLKERFPYNSEGYVILYESFYFLGEDYLSQKQIYDYLSINNQLDYKMFKILSIRFVRCKAFDELLELFQRYDRYSLRLLNDADREFLSIDPIILSFMKIDDEFKSKIINTDDEISYVDGFDIYNSTDADIISYYNSLDTNRKKCVFTFRVLLFRKHYSRLLLDNLKKILKNEKIFSDRLSFVHLISSKIFKLDSEYLVHALKSLIYFGEYYKALLMLKKYILEGGYISFDLFSVAHIIKLRINKELFNISDLLSFSLNCNPQVVSLITDDSYDLLKAECNFFNFYPTLFINNRNVNILSSKSSPRIAVCISGQLRSSLKPVYQMFKDLNNVDFYISTWDKGNFCEENTMFLK